MTRAHYSVTLLGTGTCTPSVARQQAATLLEHEALRILIDSGSGTLRRLAEVGVAPHDLDAVLYTHLHLDHTADLFPLLFSLRNSSGLSRSRDFFCIGPPGFTAFYDHLFTLYGRWVLTHRYHIHALEIAPELGLPDLIGHLLQPLQLEAIPMRHTPSSLGYRLTAPDGRCVAFTGDADESPQLETLLSRAALVVADCSTPDGDKLEGHLSPSPLGRAAQRADVHTLVLSHLYPPAETPALETEVRAVFPGKVIRARDGLRLEVPFRRDASAPPRTPPPAAAGNPDVGPSPLTPTRSSPAAWRRYRRPPG